METLGTLIDKLTVAELKRFHNNASETKWELTQQIGKLIIEINQFIVDAETRKIPNGDLYFASNKVYAKESNVVDVVYGSVGWLVSELAHANCEVWHQQERVYEFEKVPIDEKDPVIKKLAVLNLKRTQCIDLIDKQFQEMMA